MLVHHQEWSKTTVVEGLQHLFSEHGVWVKFLTGDGDSTVFARARKRTPFEDKIKKIECAYLIVQGYTSKLHTLALKTTLELEEQKKRIRTFLASQLQFMESLEILNE
ncbi:hypothetical protein PR048_013486 [Dryococelus australis]|uniref:Mutator-like transposase domain-containing protein n=1 Tax=Dryococelus australis TaxID=614101 RepID=A0ABQ9HT61_9NEOP|nr:hypothetical protein PR048_013486 [Dryococelus australis]